MSEGQRTGRFQLKQGEQFTLPLSFCSTQVLSGLGDAHPHW